MGFLSGVDEVETDRTGPDQADKKQLERFSIVFGPTETEKIWPSVA